MSSASLTPSASRCEMTQIVMPGHANGESGVMFGGIMMQWIDVCAGVAAMRHAGGTVLTASIDRLDFMAPVRVGEVVILQAQVNYAHRTSMEVGCRVDTEDMASRKRRNTTKAYLTFVAIDDAQRPRDVPALVCATDEDHRRFAQAKMRRTERLAAAGRLAAEGAP